MTSISMIKKTVIAGDSGVGKNTFLRQVYNVIFDDAYLSSIGALVGKYATELEYDGNQISLKLLSLDVTGRENFASVRKSYFQAVDGAIIMGRTDRKESIDELAGWTRKVNEVAGKVPVVYVINKVGRKGRCETKVRKLAEQENTQYWLFDILKERKETLLEPVEYLGRRLVAETLEAKKVAPSGA